MSCKAKFFCQPAFETHTRVHTDTHATLLEMYEGSVLDGLPPLSYANNFPPMQLCDWFTVINILPACDFVSPELLCQQAALKRDFVTV